MKRPVCAFLPLDDRPPNLQFPRRLAAVGGVALRMPPKAPLGHFLRAGEPDLLERWLFDAAPGADAAIVSCDMLAYGGLIASRRPDTPTKAAIARVRQLRNLKRSAPGLRVYAFAVIPRLGLTVATPEEAALGVALARYHQLRYRPALDEAEAEELSSLSARLPRAVIAMHERMRRRNLQVNRELIARVAQGVVDFLVLAQEDAPPTGPHVIEQAELTDEARRLGVSGRVSIYPGADEVGIALLARAAAEYRKACASVYPMCSTPDGATCVALFEDRALGLTVGGQIEGIGFEVAASEDAADIVLGFHAPHLPRQTDINCVDPASAPSPGFMQRVADLTRAGRTVALADVAYCNGADPALIDALRDHKLLPQLAAFAAWNTAGNTIGTALAHGALRWMAKLDESGRRSARSREAAARAHIEFLCERLVDDYGYQTLVRREAYQFAREKLGVFPLNLASKRRPAVEFVRRRLEPIARRLFAKHLRGAQVDGHTIAALADLRIRSPWPRLFEVEVEARIATR